MLNKKVLLSVIAIAIMCLTLGFFTLSGDDPTTSVSSSTFRSSEQTPSITGDFLGSWSVGTAVPAPGSYGGAGVGFSKNDTCWLYTIHGDTDGSGGTVGRFRKYNITTNTWTNLPNNVGRTWTSAAKLGPVSNTIIYTFGGFPTGVALPWTSMTGTLQSYSLNTNIWTTLTAAPVPAGSSGFSGYQDSLLYAVGGMGTTSAPITNVQLYNVLSGTWRQATPLPVARANGWMIIRSDTIYYGCGAGPTTATFNNNIYVGVISQSDRSVITWTTSAVTYPGTSRHRMDASDFGGLGIFIGPGAGATWWGTGNDAYTWQGGSSAFVSVGPVPVLTSDAHVGTASFQRGNYKVWKAVVASGLVLAIPYYTTNTQIYTDSVFSPVTPLLTYPSNICSYGLLPAYPSGMFGHANAILGDTLYITGSGSAGSASTTVQRYAINTGIFSTGSPLPESKAGHALVQAGNSLYLIGGGATVSTAGTTCWKYTPATGWTSIAPLPVGNCGHGAVNWGDSVIFVMGGPYAAPTTAVYYYRIASNTWGTTTSCLAGRRTAAYGIVGNKLLIMAGYNAAFFKNVQVGTIGANASTITWVAGPNVPLPAAKTGSSRPGGVGVGERFYFVTGEVTPAPTWHDSIYVFDATSNTWTSQVLTGRGTAGTSSNYWEAVDAWVAPNGKVKIFIGGGSLTNAPNPGLYSIQVDPCTITSIGGNETPLNYNLSQNYPNPFNPVTKINYALPKSGLVTLKVYDILGKEVITLVNEMKSAGNYSIDFNGANLSSGVYFYSLKSGDFSAVKKMTLIK